MSACSAKQNTGPFRIVLKGRCFYYLLCLFAECNLTHSVSLHNSIIQLNGLYIACEVVDSFAGDTSVLGNSLYLLRSCNADFFKRYGKTDLKTEVLNFLEFLFRRTLKHKLYKRAECNATAVICVLYAERSNAVVE